MEPRLKILLSALLCGLVAAAADASPPLGATPDATGTTFRVWAPHVDSVAVLVNKSKPIPLVREPGHADPDDTTWTVEVPSAKPGDQYRYVIKCNGVVAQFNDPRAQELTSPYRNAWSVIVDPGPDPAPFDHPALNDLVIYEMHVGSFNAEPDHLFNFAGAAQKLDYLKSLGVNAVQLMPVNENKLDFGHIPFDYDWGYDPLQYFSVKLDYGTPADLKDFVRQCHAHGIAAILDVVYNHAPNDNFLERWGGFSSDNLPDGVYFYGGQNGRSPWGPRPDFSRPQVRQYVADSVRTWIKQYGFDGLRWDSVSNIRAYDDRHPSESINHDGIDLLQASNSEFPDKIMIAEDLRSAPVVTLPIQKGGLGFQSQWDNELCGAIRKTVGTPADADRDIQKLADQIETKIGADAFGRVIYDEDHDQVGHQRDRTGGYPQVRLPSVIDPHANQSQHARKLSTLAAAIILTAPGVPMLFQGQEMFDPRPFDFNRAPFMAWGRVQTYAPVLQLYRDLISLRRNLAGTTAGLRGQNCQVIHVDNRDHTLAYRRWDHGGPRDDVVVLANLSQSWLPDVKVGFPTAGAWLVRCDTSSTTYDPDSQNAGSSAAVAKPEPADGMNFSGHLAIGPYSVLILSKD